MPNIFVTIPHGTFRAAARSDLVARINHAAATAEQIPDKPTMRALCWLVIDEAQPGNWTCGGADMTSQLLPCIAVVYVPQGVLDPSAKSLYVRLLHEAFKQAQPTADGRALTTSILLHEAPDGTWGGNGVIRTLPALAQMAGYAHLQHLIPNV